MFRVDTYVSINGGFLQNDQDLLALDEDQKGLRQNDHSINEIEHDEGIEPNRRHKKERGTRDDRHRDKEFQRIKRVPYPRELMVTGARMESVNDGKVE